VSHILVLFNLKDGVDVAEYEAWAKSTDLPNVNGLDSVNRFEVLKMKGFLRGDAAPPYQYAEIIEVPDMDAFFNDVGSDTMQKTAAEFQQYADNPMFIVCDSLG